MIFFLRLALRDIQNNQFLHGITIVTIALSILIFSGFTLIYVNTSDIMNAWKKGVKMLAYLKQDVPNPKITELNNAIRSLKGVRAVVFISKSKALASLKERMKRQSSLFENMVENPLPDAFEIHIGNATQNWEFVEPLAAEIEALDEVEHVEYGQRWLGRFIGIFNLFRMTGFVMGSLLLLATIFIVANTIRLVIYTRLEEMEIMRLVGATKHFIKMPFYLQGLIQGAFGGAVGLGGLFLTWLIISNSVEQGLSSYFMDIRFLPSGAIAGIIFCSTFTGWLGCFFSLKQFLKD